MSFFCTVGPTLAGEINEITNCSAEHFFDKPLRDSIFLEPPKLTEIFDKIMSLKDKAVGPASISAFSVKAAQHEITPFVKILIDFVISEGFFPIVAKLPELPSFIKTA